MVQILYVKITHKEFQNEMVAPPTKYPQIEIRTISTGSKVSYGAKVSFNYEALPPTNPCTFYAELELKINKTHPYISREALDEFVRYLRMIKAYVEGNRKKFLRYSNKPFLYFKEFENIRVYLLRGEEDVSVLEPFAQLYDTVDVFNELMKILQTIIEPYDTCGIEVKTFRDTGGDYPSGKLEFTYYA